MQYKCNVMCVVDVYMFRANGTLSGCSKIGIPEHVLYCALELSIVGNPARRHAFRASELITWIDFWKIRCCPSRLSPKRGLPTKRIGGVRLGKPVRRLSATLIVGRYRRERSRVGPLWGVVICHSAIE